MPPDTTTATITPAVDDDVGRIEQALYRACRHFPRGNEEERGDQQRGNGFKFAMAVGMVVVGGNAPMRTA